MNQNQFVEWLVEAMLGWSRWLADMLWGSVNSGGQGGILAWFSYNWLRIVLFLVVVGVVVDWFVWMVRWRPYWLWFHKRQIIYEDETRRPREGGRPAPRQHPAGSRERAFDYDDLFAAPEIDSGYDDPFGQTRTHMRPIAGEDERDSHTRYARPARQDDEDEDEDEQIARTRYARPVRQATRQDEYDDEDEDEQNNGDEDLWAGFEEEELAPEPDPDEVWVAYHSEEDDIEEVIDESKVRFGRVSGDEFDGVWTSDPDEDEAIDFDGEGAEDIEDDPSESAAGEVEIFPDWSEEETPPRRQPRIDFDEDDEDSGDFVDINAAAEDESAPRASRAERKPPKKANRPARAAREKRSKSGSSGDGWFSE